MTTPAWTRFLDIAALDDEGARTLIGRRAVCTHQHRIDLANAPGMAASHFSSEVRRDWTVDDLRSATDSLGFTRRVLVQVVDPWDGSPEQSGASNLGDVEAGELCALVADNDDCIAAIVSVDFRARDVESRLDALARDGAQGVRLIHTQGASAGDNPFAEPAFVALCELAAARGLTLELLCREQLGQLPQVLALLGEVPGLRVVINHGGNPAGLDGAGPSTGYRAFLDALAARGRVAMKTALDEWAPRAAAAETFYPFWDAMHAAGGIEWLLFETNFPVCLDSGYYASPEAGFRDAVGRQLGWLIERGHGDALDAFVSTNAERWYGQQSSIS